MSAIKTLATKLKLAKKMRQNRPMPNWFRLCGGRKMQYGNRKRRNWRRTKLNL
ncbi:MAG: 60S ribosomal protein L39 [Amphiamblys sp. WSBS2006]|nr:MAG: 60S ribosomal protein L39 [Amphiamblys sp. WSBS2006]